MQLRPYQLQAIDKLDGLASFCNVKAPLLVAPTGSGKTVIAAEIIRRAGGESRTLFLAPRRELIHQTSRKLSEIGVHHGILLAGSGGMDLYANVQVGSVDTLISRTLRNKRLQLAAPHRIIMDEAHVGLTPIRQQLLAQWASATIIGLTATPTRSDGRAMGAIYDELIEVATTRELTEQGYLVGARYFSVSEPDLRRVRTTAGDYNRGDLDELMNRAKLTGDIVEHWLKHAPKRRTVVFATTIPHSVALAQQFLTQGVAAEHVDANTPQAARDAIFDRFSSGRTQVLTNCTLASIGFDLPALDCVVFARPTKSLGLYLQMLGRGLRTAPGKQDCLVLDHAGNVHRHGFATDPRYWTLHGKYAVDEKRTQEAKRKQAEEGVVQLTCPECKCVFAGSNTCPSCGYYFAPKPRAKLTRDGQLVEITRSGQLDLQDAMPEEKRRLFYLQLVGYGEMRSFKPGWAAYKYKERFGAWPPNNWRRHASQHGGIDPTIETMRWIKAKQMEWKRVKAREYQPNREATEAWLEDTGT